MGQVIKTNIDEAIARIDDWKGKNVTYKPVIGGITNPNYRVTVDGTDYFLKIPGDGTDFIDRDNCHEANMIAANSGVGAKVMYYFADTGVEVFEWLDGYLATETQDMYQEKICMAAIEAIRDFHNLPGAKLPVEESLFDQCRDMVARTQAGGDYMPPWHEHFMWIMDRIERAFNHIGVEKKPCHNDYWNANWMWNKEKQEGKIIDLEYASMNDPMYDVALFMLGFSTEAMDKEAVIEYNHGVYDDTLFARMQLNKIAADIKWTYWALQQAVNSNVQFDYFNWYTGKVARLRYYFEDPRVDIWLNQLEGRPVWRMAGVWDKYK